MRFLIEVIDSKSRSGTSPVNDTTEYMAGFWLISADSLEQAQELARLGSKACNRKVEVRPLIG
ncbi:MAG: hypothetical protein EBT65_06040 [Actinobacteria bacterium]|nr:hypothetical protein [Actinomycetota bacterium]